MNSRGFAELPGVAGPVLVPPASEPGLDLPLGQPALPPQAQQLPLQTGKAHPRWSHDQPAQVGSGRFLQAKTTGVWANGGLLGCVYVAGRHKNQNLEP